MFLLVLLLMNLSLYSASDSSTIDDHKLVVGMVINVVPLIEDTDADQTLQSEDDILDMLHRSRLETYALYKDITQKKEMPDLVKSVAHQYAALTYSYVNRMNIDVLEEFLSEEELTLAEEIMKKNCHYSSQEECLHMRQLFLVPHVFKKTIAWMAEDETPPLHEINRVARISHIYQNLNTVSPIAKDDFNCMVKRLVYFPSLEERYAQYAQKLLEKSPAPEISNETMNDLKNHFIVKYQDHVDDILASTGFIPLCRNPEKYLNSQD